MTTATSPITLTDADPMYLVVADHVGCLRCQHIGTQVTRDATGRAVAAWWVTETENPATNIGPFCSDYCARRWVKGQG